MKRTKSKYASLSVTPRVRLAELPPILRSVAQGIVRGLTTQEIADARGVSVKTVDTQRATVLKALGESNAVTLTHRAIREGFLVLE